MMNGRKRQRRSTRGRTISAAAAAGAVTVISFFTPPVLNVVEGSANHMINTIIDECIDDPTYRSRLGLSCSEHVSYDVLGGCDTFIKIGFSSQEVSKMKQRCRKSCGAGVGQCSRHTISTSSNNSMEPEWRTVVTSNERSDIVDILHAVPSSVIATTKDGRRLQRARSCYRGWSASCQDDPLYRSKMRVPCWRHSTLDCSMFGHIGFSDAELLDLITRCPCSCGIECGSFTISPSAAPSNQPSAGPSATPSASPFSSPSSSPSSSPTVTASAHPSISFEPSNGPTDTPSTMPTSAPTFLPTSFPTSLPSQRPSTSPSAPPTMSAQPSAAPTVAPDVIVWSTTQAGLRQADDDRHTINDMLQPESGRYGWTISDKGLYVSFSAEKSRDCSEGGNENIQGGTATARFFVPEGERIALNYTLGGLGETMDTGFEEMVLSVDGTRIASSTSTGLGVECSIHPVQVTYEVEPPYVLEPGIHRLRVDFSTFDDFDHYGIVYVILFAVSPIVEL